MFGHPVRVLLSLMGGGCHFLFFKHKIDHQVSGSPYAEYERKPTYNEQPLGRSVNIHTP